MIKYSAVGWLRVLVLLSVVGGLPQYALGQGGLSWVGTWGVAPVAQGISVSGSNPLTFNQQTLRQIVHTSVAGSAARIHISNVFGTTPLTIQDVHIALSANNSGSSIVTGSDHTVTFQGSSAVTIAAGSEAVSDSIDFAVPALGDVAITLYFPGTATVSNTTTHVFTEETNFYASGDVSGAVSLPGAAATGQYYFSTSDYERALEIFVKLTSEFKKLPKSAETCEHLDRISRYMAAIHSLKGEYEASVNQYMASLPYLECAATKTSDFSVIYRNIGTTYLKEKDYKQARKYLKLAEQAVQARLKHVSLDADLAFSGDHSSGRHLRAEVTPFFDRDFARADVDQYAAQDNEQHYQKKEPNQQYWQP